jgi:UDP-glucose:(heptosyl)LPS alpha-1,3-glucosyltransferase
MKRLASFLPELVKWALPRRHLTRSVAGASGGTGAPNGLRIAVAVQAIDRLGGKERDALAIARGLAARGHEITILTRSARLPVPTGIALRITGGAGWTNHALARNFARAVAAVRNAGQFDALLSFDKLRDADAYYAADVCFADRAHGAKAWLPRSIGYAGLEAECIGAGGPDILFLCRRQADEYRRHYRVEADRAVVLPPMIHDSGRDGFYERRAAIRRSFGIPDSATLAASVAVYPRQKGIDRSIAALREVPQLHLLAVGLNDVASSKALAAKQGLGARAHFCGYRDDIGDILGAADLMLHPARVENTGLVILESLLAGVPVIASAACGFAEYIECFGAGTVLAEPFDAAAYIAAIRAALEPNRLAELRRRARDSAPQLRAQGGLERIVDVIEDRLARRL